MRTQWIRCWILAATCAVASLVSRPVHAANAAQVSEAPVDRMVALNRRALADIQSQHYHAAKYWLEEALVISETAGLDNDDATARTYLHLAVVALAGSKDRDEALRSLALALKINPNIDLTPGLEVSGLRSVYLQARQQAGLPPNPDPTAAGAGPSPSGAQDGGDALASASEAGGRDLEPGQAAQVRAAYATALLDEPDLPAHLPTPLYCQIPNEHTAGQDIIVRCLTQRHPRRSSAIFHYRLDQPKASFVELPLDRTPKGWLAAVVAARALQGKAISYFVTAQVPGNDRPLYLAYPEAPRAVAVRSDPGATGSAAAADASQPLPRPGWLWLALAGGSGAVYHGRENLDGMVAKTGFSPATLFQVEPEVGYQMSERLSLSLVARYQYASLEPGEAASGEQKASSASAFAMFVEAKVPFASAGNFRGYASGGAGFGHFLAVVDGTCEAGACPGGDALHGGVAAVNAGVGILYHLSKRVSIFADAKEMASLPKFMALTEVNLGIAVALSLLRSS